MNSLILIPGIVAVVMMVIALLALRRAGRAGAHCLDLELLLIDADQRIEDIEKQILRLMEDGTITAGRVDKLAADQGRLASGEKSNGFGEAIALIQHGASVEQLISTCGISRAEARLVETLYGNGESTESPGSPGEYGSADKFALVDAHLEAVARRPEA